MEMNLKGKHGVYEIPGDPENLKVDVGEFLLGLTDDVKDHDSLVDYFQTASNFLTEIVTGTRPKKDIKPQVTALAAKAILFERAAIEMCSNKPPYHVATISANSAVRFLQSAEAKEKLVAFAIDPEDDDDPEKN